MKKKKGHCDLTSGKINIDLRKYLIINVNLQDKKCYLLFKCGSFNLLSFFKFLVISTYLSYNRSLGVFLHILLMYLLHY